jgi:integrase
MADGVPVMKERGDIKDVPSKPKIKVPVRDVRVLSIEEQSQIITNLVPHHRIIFETLAALGCRPGEICALKKRDLVGGRAYIQRAFDNAGHLKETKSNKIQCKMLPPDLYARLGELCRDRLPEAFIFSGQRGAPYRPVYLTQLWKTAARKAEIPVPLYVGTRHSFATQRWEEIQKAGADKLASEMGHASAGTTFSHYVRTVPNLSPVGKKPS